MLTGFSIDGTLYMPLLLLRLANALSFFGISYKHTQFAFIPAHQLRDIPKSRASPHAERPPNADNIQHLSHHVPNNPSISDSNAYTSLHPPWL